MTLGALPHPFFEEKKMGTVISNALGLLLMIFLGYLTKRLGILAKADGGTVSRIIIHVTLPAAIIVSLSSLTLSAELLVFILFGFILNVLMILLGGLFSTKSEPLERKFMMYNISGYNIGNFTLPFLQSFFPIGIPFIALFDIGNSFMLAGGSPVLIDRIAGGDRKEKQNVFYVLAHSVPFITYVAMLVLRLLDWQLPATLLDMVQRIGNANGFLSMFMIGLYLDLRLPRKAWQTIQRVLLSRYAAALVLVLLLQILPLAATHKIVLSVLVLAPIPTFSVINSVQAGVAEETEGFISSLSILISLVLMTAMMLMSLR